MQGEEHVETETLALVTCANCGREREPAELWRILPTAEAGDVYWVLPVCALREFGES